MQEVQGAEQVKECQERTERRALKWTRKYEEEAQSHNF
jgi:hypothetical protein